MTKYKSVLLIDDDPAQTLILKAYFQQLRIDEIEIASDAEKFFCVDGRDPNEFDLVVSDLQMPKMDGFELLRHMWKFDYIGDIALMSGVARKLLEHASRLAQMHGLNLIGYVNKPLAKASLDEIFLASDDNTGPKFSKDRIKITPDEFKAALLDGQIKPYYQPQIEIASGRIVGAETLARWVKSDGSIISPNAFLPIAEETGQMGELTLRLYTQVLEDTQTFLKTNSSLSFAINLSPGLISDVTLPECLSNMRREMGIPARNLRFEITEDSILNVQASTLEVLSRLQVLGHGVAIDDFGTGSSNIQTLRDFPFTELKIDRSFIHKANINEFSAQTINAAVALAKQLDMQTVAEGVENLTDWNFAKDAGVDFVQGFFVEKALSPLAFLDFINKHQNGFDPQLVNEAA